MTAISVAVVHGINTDVHALAALVSDVENLIEGACDAPAAYSAIRWSSSGTIAGDVFAMRSRDWMRLQLDAVKRQLFRAKPDIVIGHSFGGALAHAAVTECGMKAPVVAIGSPHAHPMFGLFLALAGMRPAVPQYRVRVDIWNRDDDVTAMLGMRTKLAGWQSVRVAVAGDLGLEEHSHRRYIYGNGRSGPLHGATLRAITPLVLRAAGVEVQ